MGARLLTPVAPNESQKTKEGGQKRRSSGRSRGIVETAAKREEREK